MGSDDEGDIKKARGFLLTYSAGVLALLFFGAELSELSLLGNKITLHDHKEHAWLIVAGLNVYFWFRYYQRLPDAGRYFDGPMNDLYDSALQWFAVKLTRRQQLTAIREAFDAKKSGGKLRLHSGRADILCHDQLAEDERLHGDEAPELHQVGRAVRTKMRIVASYSHHLDGSPGMVVSSSVQCPEYTPPLLIAWGAKLFAFVKGAFITPWFTDHIAPLVLGAVSITCALSKWFAANFVS